jgi:hypothetical protein
MVTSTHHCNYDSTMDIDEQHDMLDNQSVMHTNHDYISNLNTNKQHDMSGDHNTTHMNESQPHVSSCTSTSNDQVIISTFNSNIVKKRNSSKNTTQDSTSASSSDVAKKRNISENTIQPDTSDKVEKRNSIGNTSSLPHPVHDINTVSNKEMDISVLK